MPDPIIRINNCLGLMKAETVEGVDAVPAAGVDAIMFEIDSLEIGDPYTTDANTEVTGTDIMGIPTIIGQPVSFKIRFRMKGVGAGTAYTALIKPPHHVVYQACGLRGVFQAAVAATALASGTATSATLAAPYVATAGQYVGQRLIVTGGTQSGAQPLISDYSAARLATLVDTYGVALSATNSVEIKPNWTYARTSPATAAERTADQPSNTFYAHEDGVLTKLFGLRGTGKIMADTAKAGYFEMTGTAIWGGQSNVAQPTNANLLKHNAPTLNMMAAISPAFIVNRKPLPISQFSYDVAAKVESMEDPNTALGFGAGLIGEREPMLECDPYKHQDLTVRSHIGDLEAAIGGAAGFTAGVRAGTASGNRWAVTMPNVNPVRVARGKRKIAFSETCGFRALSNGRDANGRDTDMILCFD